jgi:NAD+ diphosphatase
MIQDIYPRHFDNHYDPQIEPDDESMVIVICEKSFLLHIDQAKETVAYPKLGDLSGIRDTDLVYLFSIDKERFFLYLGTLVGVSYDKENFAFTSFASVRRELFSPKHYILAAFTAMHLAEWYDVTRFCGKCGGQNVNDESERARVCPKCGNKIYPRINPAVIIGVTDKNTNKLVLTKYRTGFAHNALVAGFTEIGETLEETVAREVMEEVGLKVGNIRYYKSQPWGVASDILAGFFCDVEGSTEICMDDQELKFAEWTAPEDIVLQPVDYSLTNEMMSLFKDKGYNGTISGKY